MTPRFDSSATVFDHALNTPGADRDGELLTEGRGDEPLVEWLTSTDGQMPDHDVKQAIADELVGLQQRLKTMPAIEQAKGILMGHFGIDGDTAFGVLRRWSSHHNLKLRVIAAQLTAAAAYRHPPGAAIDAHEPTTLHRVIAIFQTPAPR